MSQPVATTTPTSKPKPCCVCKVEKATRDECLLKNGEESGKCDGMITSYKKCMAGYGFKI
ncbi:copper metallochaperone [Saccharomycopsis crataegensis]|uniref:Copper metallochaperone n=1 Tax=Saccharomycopsis crataegensis TaxID=43959 RepID=A0AAV5QML5_9ASCO|nr:copper metallochaperone [Saccharomycopsis crataegensis]